jgi:hypothetical protein
MKQSRLSLAKTYLTPDQHDDLVADAKAAGHSVSTILRDAWLKCRNGKPAARPVARPKPVPFPPKFAPGRAARRPVHMRS